MRFAGRAASASVGPNELASSVKAAISANTIQGLSVAATMA